ncbi:MAG: glutamine--fructose-6-phosphate transaminase (isomerizing) [Clostridia bacterium]|nr:glutamine--fructose-6-phosphate transaminase (isomerizing) [Clostridia bacterium]
MCGIVGYVGDREAAPLLLFGLERLEYRGYDSAGLAVQDAQGGIAIAKAAGRLHHLVQMTQGGHALQGTCGVGHTRWATHGAPDERNAHPHTSPDGRVALVHNGVIENHHPLREALMRQGYAFLSDTDTEAAALLLGSLYASCAMDAPHARALCAIRGMMQKLRGSYAMGILFADQPGTLYAVRQGSPLLVGVCEDGHMLASGTTAFSGMAKRAIALLDGEIACITAAQVQLFGQSGEGYARAAEPVEAAQTDMGRQGYAHYMIKEIMEQPRAVQDTIAAYLPGGRVEFGSAGISAERLAQAGSVLFVGCGSAYHAGLVGAHVLRQLAGVRAQAQLASEVCGACSCIAPDTLAVCISQSGETADSLAALRLLRAQGVFTLAVVNVPGSAMAREADAVLLTRAGVEISVATTKAYSAQLAALYLLAAALAQAKESCEPKRLCAFLDALRALPDAIEAALQSRSAVRTIAERIAHAQDVYMIGRGLDYALCMEAALKLKEVAYIHAEAYAAGELKHGTLSLIEAGVPVWGVFSQAHTAGKTAANMAESGARGAWLSAAAMEGIDAELPPGAIRMPGTDPLLAASVMVVPMQFLAYETGCAKGIDVDKPRNLAKSVTVE